jgi:hypothetical protein
MDIKPTNPQRNLKVGQKQSVLEGTGLDINVDVEGGNGRLEDQCPPKGVTKSILLGRCPYPGPLLGGNGRFMPIPPVFPYPPTDCWP